MSLLTQARLRPSRKKSTIRQQQFIAFRLRQEWFALPIAAVERIIPRGDIYGNSPEVGLGLTLYQGKPLLVVDVGHHLFGETATSPQVLAEQFLLILFDTQQQQFVGVPIDSAPVLKKLLLDAMEPLPDRYQSAGKIRCVSASTVQAAGEALLFLLDPAQLFASLVLASPELIAPECAETLKSAKSNSDPRR
ncbi:MAG: chemotaxis protein CheW [Synechococcales cyanobacterium RU_4_20]|nr:chemotaxis protein CheW [Synechococcales cyanobacterium RU_4_20]NJR68151.1 chemotaxis protein CheW [Synechococcales cyanobacterium CRU_2_2]